jgi:hypothetical protein
MTTNLGTLLQNISTEKGRAKIVKNIVGKNKIPEHYITEAINFFEKEGKEYTHLLTDAAKLAKKADRKEKSTQIYQEAINKETREGNISYAARIAENAQMFETAIKLHSKASQKDKIKKNFYSAAQELEQASKSAKNIKNLELEKKLNKNSKRLFVQAVKKFSGKEARDWHFDDTKILKNIQEITEKAGMPNETPKLYEAVIKEYEKRWDTIPGAGYRDAAMFAKRVGMKEKAKELSLSAINCFAKNDSYRALKLAKEFGGVAALPIKIKENILTSMDEDRNSSEAAELAEEMGLPNKVKEFYIKAMENSEEQGNLGKASLYAEKVGMKEKANSYKKLIKIIGKDSIY